MDLNSEKVAPRISVLDARELDSAIFRIIKSQADGALKHLPVSVLINYGLEIETILKFLIWKLSIGRAKASFGQQLLHLRYSNDSKSSNLQYLALLTIGAPYIKEKLVKYYNARSEHDEKSKKITKLIEDIETSIKILNVFTFIRFLWRGGAPTFLEILLRLKPISNVTPSKRSVGYSYMMRELIWHGFIELLLILLPIVSYHKLRNRLSKIFNWSKKKGTAVEGKCVLTALTLCEICKEPPILPTVMGCTHAFCYLCLASNREADSSFECPECGYSNQDPNVMKPAQVL